ncbi:MAG: response regulator, partial [Candidatus Limnocylindria bacterium]
GAGAAAAAAGSAPGRRWAIRIRLRNGPAIRCPLARAVQRRNGVTSRRRVVLVVEDDEAIGQLLATAINDEDGYQAVRAATPSEALRALEAVRADLLMLDVRLPGMSGLELYDRLKADPRYAGLPVVFQSANTAECADEFRRRGITAYLRKPFDLNDVMRAVKRLAPAVG